MKQLHILHFFATRHRRHFLCYLPLRRSFTKCESSHSLLYTRIVLFDILLSSETCCVQQCPRNRYYHYNVRT